MFLGRLRARSSRPRAAHDRERHCFQARPGGPNLLVVCRRQHVGFGLVASGAQVGAPLHAMGHGVPRDGSQDHARAAFWARCCLWRHARLNHRLHHPKLRGQLAGDGLKSGAYFDTGYRFCGLGLRGRRRIA
jgi:hypothetical protein